MYVQEIYDDIGTDEYDAVHIMDLCKRVEDQPGCCDAGFSDGIFECNYGRREEEFFGSGEISSP